MKCDLCRDGYCHCVHCRVNGDRCVTCSPGGNVAERLTGRINDLEAQRANYLAYQSDRVKEHDHHGAWDAAINLSEVECEIAGLRFAQDLITKAYEP